MLRPPPSDRVKLVFTLLPFQGWKPFAPPLPVWLKLQATILKVPHNLLCPPSPSAWLKPFLPPPLLTGQNFTCPPPYVIAPPPPKWEWYLSLSHVAQYSDSIKPYIMGIS